MDLSWTVDPLVPARNVRGPSCSSCRLNSTGVGAFSLGRGMDIVCFCEVSPESLVVVFWGLWAAGWGHQDFLTEHLMLIHPGCRNTTTATSRKPSSIVNSILLYMFHRTTKPPTFTQTSHIWKIHENPPCTSLAFVLLIPWSEAEKSAVTSLHIVFPPKHELPGDRWPPPSCARSVHESMLAPCRIAKKNHPYPYLKSEYWSNLWVPSWMINAHSALTSTWKRFSAALWFWFQQTARNTSQLEVIVPKSSYQMGMNMDKRYNWDKSQITQCSTKSGVLLSTKKKTVL